MKTIQIMKMAVVAIISAFALSSCSDDDDTEDPVTPSKNKTYVSTIAIPVHQDSKDAYTVDVTVNIDGTDVVYTDIASNSKWTTTDDALTRSLMSLANEPKVDIRTIKVEGKKSLTMAVKYTAGTTSKEEVDIVTGYYFDTTNNDKYHQTKSSTRVSKGIKVANLQDLLDLYNGTYTNINLIP